jgi:uncharacterized protein YjiK
MRTRVAVALAIAALLVAASWWLLPGGRSATDGARAATFSDVLTHAMWIPAGLVGVAEASGIAYHRALDRLFVVGDEGRLAELDVTGRRVRVALVQGDIEDVAVHTPTGLLLLVAERKARLIVFDPRTFTERARWRLSRKDLLDHKTKGKREGFEGLAFRSGGPRSGDGLLLLAHQRHPAMVVTVALDLGMTSGASMGDESVVERWSFPRETTLAGLTYVAQLDRYLLIDSHERRLFVLDPAGHVQAAYGLPGAQPEGLCFDSRGTLWIADDRAGLLRCPHALAALRAALRGQV